MKQQAFEFGDLVNYEGATWVIDRMYHNPENPFNRIYSILPLAYQDPDLYDALIASNNYDHVSKQVFQSQLVEIEYISDIILSPSKSLDSIIQSASTRAPASQPTSQVKTKEPEPEI